MTYHNKSVLNIKVVKIKVFILNINHNFCPCTVNMFAMVGKRTAVYCLSARHESYHQRELQERTAEEKHQKK